MGVAGCKTLSFKKRIMELEQVGTGMEQLFETDKLVEVMNNLLDNCYLYLKTTSASDRLSTTAYIGLSERVGFV